MTETTLSPEDAAAQRASEQARLRKERREAKIKAGGSARLSKITGASGGLPHGRARILNGGAPGLYPRPQARCRRIGVGRTRGPRRGRHLGALLRA
ncbi:hypothetical protein G7Z17_g12205 [Cylindrodendrum hubeiense]|uniref:Uncharacterized protein n=1 Tax=Cylindrodendrum hubeiense TaxID=595255 RepID=A0A9P5GVV6_9HYPO|nr:hypothetical protein G7Z17_g12205 [Cylindrodendrum hubeiense]